MSPSAKRALVTGGSGGIGAAICRELGAAGHFVYVHANRNTDAAEAVAAEIIAAGGAAKVISFDVTDGAGARAALEALVESAPVQILVNNAGVHDDAAFPGMTARQWHRVIDVSIDGFFNVTQPLVLPMIRTRWGRIINISSVSAISGNRGQVNYAASNGNDRPPLRCGDDRRPGSDEAHGFRRGGGEPGGLSCLTGGRLHHGTDHLRQRRDGLMRVDAYA